MDGTFRPTLLLSMPQLQDPNFARTVVLLCDFAPEGAFGLVLNRPTEMPASTMVRLDPPIVGGNELPLCIGGPVEPERGWILTGDDAGRRRVPRDPARGCTCRRRRSLLRRVLSTTPAPPRARVLAGYAGWGPGQLDKELAQSAWLMGDVELDLGVRQSSPARCGKPQSAGSARTRPRCRRATAFTDSHQSAVISRQSQSSVTVDRQSAVTVVSPSTVDRQSAVASGELVPTGDFEEVTVTVDCRLPADCDCRPPDCRLPTESLSRENFFEERQRLRVLRLTQPEHRLLPDLAIRVRAGDVDEERDAFGRRQLAQCEDGLLLDLGVRIVVDPVRDRARRPWRRPSGRARRSPRSALPASAFVFATLMSAATPASSLS